MNRYDRAATQAAKAKTSIAHDRANFVAGTEWARERARLDAERQINEATARAEKAEATIARVRQMHFTEVGTSEGDIECGCCRTWWPCETIRALDGGDDQ